MIREWYRAVQWPANDSEKIWAPVIARAAATWTELELASVTWGLRPSALVYIAETDLPTATRDVVRAGLGVTAVGPGRYAIHTKGLEEYWVNATTNSEYGRLLGYPECCQAHFERTWQVGVDHLAAMPEANGPWPINIFLRSLGVRLIPWLPCSATCAASLDFAERLLSKGAAAGLDLPPLEALLRLPATWDARSGIAVITTPVFRLCVSCDVKTGHEVRAREGKVIVPEPTSWEDNGFSSAAAMEASHAVILGALADTQSDSVLDLGCGDGALLSKLRGRRVGVEIDPERASRGAARHPDVTILEGRIEELPEYEGEPFAVVLLMPGRLLEMDAVTRSAVKEKLDRIAGRILAYTYGDHGTLPALLDRAGLRPIGEYTSNGRTSAAFVEVI